MAGLLDNFLGSSIDDPKTQATTAAIQGLLGGRGALQGISGGLLAYGGSMAQAKQQQAQEEMRRLQMQQQQMALAQAQRAAKQQEAQDAFRQSIPSPQFQAGLDVLAANGGVTQAGNAQVPKVDPNQELLYGALKAGLVDPIQYIQSQRKDTTPLITKAGDVARDPRTGKELWRNEDKADMPAALKEYQFAKSQGYGGSFLDFQLAQRKAGAPSVSVNTGQHGFDNTLKLRSDFRSEPVYKAHQEMQSAYSQIQQALKAGTPVGDLAGATKIMKLLDPGSVVRESELGMAMSATGLEDRLRNYVGNVINGTKLTPQQRKEFQSLADQLMAQSSHLYNAKRGEYGQIAQRNGLGVEDVVGAAGAVPKLPSVVRMPGASAQDAGDAEDPLGLRKLMKPGG